MKENTILCPTRGGEASFPNQDRAIDLAKERGAEMLFLYVSNVRFLSRAASAVLVDMQREMDELGEFMLLMAQERAAAAGVRARTSVRQGMFREALAAVCSEEGVATIVLGTSGDDTGATDREYREELVQWILDELSKEVFLTHEGHEVLHRLPPLPPVPDCSEHDVDQAQDAA